MADHHGLLNPNSRKGGLKGVKRNLTDVYLHANTVDVVVHTAVDLLRCTANSVYM